MRHGDGERGSAVVEFTLVSVLLIGLFLAILQFAFVLHVRNTLTASAAEGARLAATLDRVPEDAVGRTRSLISAALPDHFGQDVRARYLVADGLDLVQVEVRTVLPLVGWLGIDQGLQVQAHAVVEGQW